MEQKDIENGARYTQELFVDRGLLYKRVAEEVHGIYMVGNLVNNILTHLAYTDG